MCSIISVFSAQILSYKLSHIPIGPGDHDVHDNPRGNNHVKSAIIKCFLSRINNNKKIVAQG